MVIGLLAESSVRNICCLLYRCEEVERKGGRGGGARLESNRGMHAKDDTCIGRSGRRIDGRTEWLVPAGQRA